MDKKYILGKVKEWQDGGLIDSYSIDALTYDPADAERRWLNRFATAEDDRELFRMVQKEFPLQ